MPLNNIVTPAFIKKSSHSPYIMMCLAFFAQFMFVKSSVVSSSQLFTVTLVQHSTDFISNATESVIYKEEQMEIARYTNDDDNNKEVRWFSCLTRRPSPVYITVVTLTLSLWQREQVNRLNRVLPF